MVLIPYNNEAVALSSSDGDLHLDKHKLRLEALPPGTRDSGFGASTASDMEALGNPVDFSPCEDLTSFRSPARVEHPPPALPHSGVSSFLPPPLGSPSSAEAGGEMKRKKPPVPLPKPSESTVPPTKPTGAPLPPPKPTGVPIAPPKPNVTQVILPKPVQASNPEKPVVPKKPDILNFSKQSDCTFSSNLSPMKSVVEELSKEVIAKTLKTSEQRNAVLLEDPASSEFSIPHVSSEVAVNCECPKVETKFPSSFLASIKKSSKGLSQSSSPSAFQEVGTSKKPGHSPQASIVSNTSTDTSCSGNSSFSSSFHKEESATREDEDKEEEEETEEPVPAPMPQLPFIRANNRQRLFQRSSLSSNSSSGSSQSLRLANIPISTPLLLHTPLPDSSGLRHFPLFNHPPVADHSASVHHHLQLPLTHRHHHQQQQKRQEGPQDLPSPSSSVSSGASSTRDQAAMPLLQPSQQQQQMQHEDLMSAHQEIPDYSDVGSTTCEQCALGKCQTVYLHMPGRFLFYL
ncbi:hypothetical protein PoB_007053700 [Plakobranchus ocellatus]|uniref:Uncharacterized protein n=1 Tax=Plakobranchus ocellatus TaxID=259542 RepID=A0AAV4DJ25_9GAST|nr:hypothetical protein PoB_007053700 [Plakobranchus ocellatus]